MLEKKFSGRPIKKRFMLSKRNCPKCREARHSVDQFNKLNTNNWIVIIDEFDSDYDIHVNFLRKVLNDAIPTPTIYFDGHIIQYPEGGLDWFELKSILLSLNDTEV